VGAAWAVWFSTRRRYLFPFAERLLWFSSALSFFSGSHPRGQLRGGGKRFGLYPHLGNHLLRGIYSKPDGMRRHFGQSGHGLLVWFQRLRDHGVEPGDLLVDQLQSLQLQRKQLPMHRLRAAGQGIDKLLLATPQALFSQSRQFLGVALPAGQGL